MERIERKDLRADGPVRVVTLRGLYYVCHRCSREYSETQLCEGGEGELYLPDDELERRFLQRVGGLDGVVEGADALLGVLRSDRELFRAIDPLGMELSHLHYLLLLLQGGDVSSVGSVSSNPYLVDYLTQVSVLIRDLMS